MVSSMLPIMEMLMQKLGNFLRRILSKGVAVFVVFAVCVHAYSFIQQILKKPNLSTWHVQPMRLQSRTRLGD